jgi:hypothetical protein
LPLARVGTLSGVTDTEGRAARLVAAQLVAEAGVVARRSGRRPLREALRRVSRGRWGRPRGWPDFRILVDRGWQDTVAPERHGWRCRAAVLDGDTVFSADYRLCARCRIGWVEQPATSPPYLRLGLANAGLAALRTEHPGLAWHTLGGHFTDARPFWAAVGAEVPGGYAQRSLCEHLSLS